MMNDREIARLLSSIERHVRHIAEALDEQQPQKAEAGRVYSRRETARLLRVSVWTIDQARKDGRLVEAQRIGNRHVRLTGESLARFQQGGAGTRKVMRL